MISRKSTLLLAEIIARVFSESYSSHVGSQRRTKYSVKTDDLYDFLFTNNYEAWFCNSAKATGDYSEDRSRATRQLKEFILKLHTGETQASATTNWTWEQRQQLGQRYLVNLAEDILNMWEQEWSQLEQYSKPIKREEVEKLQRHLELDGYVYGNLKLFAPESDVLDVEKETSLLKHLFTSLALANTELVFHHLSLSEEHYENGKWDDSISNSRKFLECVLQEIAARHSMLFKKSPLSQNAYEKPVLVREYLENEGLLEKKEMEAISKVYGLLSQTGNHPYMAEKDQARLLRHLALTFSQFVLLRLQGCMK